MSLIGKTILLGRNVVDDVVTINDDTTDPDFFICSGKFVHDILVPKAYVVEINENGVDLECCPIKKREEKKNAPSFVEIKNLPFNVDLSDFSVYVSIKKRLDEMKVVKTSKKSVYFIDENGKVRYTGFKNIKRIINYNPDQEIPTEQVVKSKKKIAAAAVTKSKEKAKAYAEAKGRDGSDIGDANKGKESIVKTTNVSKETPKTSVVILEEVPYDFDYRKKGKRVYMDLPDGRKGLIVHRSHGGRVYWNDPNTGQYSATSWKKVNKNDNIIVYEYK